MRIPIKYNIRSLLVRRVSNAMTAGGIALVVGVFVVVMALVAGLSATIRESASARNLVVIRRGSSTETGSSLTLDQFNALKFLGPIERAADGTPLASPEISEQILMTSLKGDFDNLAIRGVLPVALKVHESVHIISGRMFAPGMNEVIVGKALIGRYSGCSLGSMMRFGRRSWKVVGVFDANGSSFESEIWGDVHGFQEDSNRGSIYNSVRLKTAPGIDTALLIQRIADDRRIDLQAEAESDYYLEQSVVARRLRTLGLVVAGIMAFGAVFAAMNTMYAAVSARTTEIGVLRSLGFKPRAILTSFLLESSVLAIAAGAVGVILATPVNRLSATFNSGLTAATLTFHFQITSAVIVQALSFAAFMGVAGGWLPARQAMKMSVISALRRM